MRYIIDRDAPYIASAAQNAINLLGSEILRLIKMPYKSWENNAKIKSLDDQIMYLEEILAAYERDRKKHG